MSDDKPGAMFNINRSEPPMTLAGVRVTTASIREAFVRWCEHLEADGGCHRGPRRGTDGNCSRTPTRPRETTIRPSAETVKSPLRL